MKFTRRRAFICRTLALATLLILTGCATAPDSVPESQAGAEGVEPLPPSALPEGPVTPNPYTQQQVSVPPGARKDFARAQEAMRAENWPQAERILVPLTEKYPSLSGPQVNLGLVLWRQERLELAERSFNRALEINPSNLEAYNQLALLKRQQGEFEAAEKLYHQALDVWPFHAQSHKNLGILYDLYRGDWQKALLHYRAYQQLQESPDPQMNGWIIDLERRIEAGQ